MEVKEAYNNWAGNYDTNHNKTRDLEAISIRETLININFDNCLEIGCGTGKNTEWLISKANKILAVDLSNEMLAKAKEKIKSDKVKFIQADILSDWNFTDNEQFDLVVFSLVLEHIKDLNNIFTKLSKVVKSDGFVYIGELHPFKQYNGTKAKFETENGLQIVTCFNHNISDFTNSAMKNGFTITGFNEYFDDNNRENIPRIMTLFLKKNNK